MFVQNYLKIFVTWLTSKNLQVNSVGVAETFFLLRSFFFFNLTFQPLFKRQKKKTIVNYALFCKVNDWSGSSPQMFNVYLMGEWCDLSLQTAHQINV